MDGEEAGGAEEWNWEAVKRLGGEVGRRDGCEAHMCRSAVAPTPLRR